MNIHSPGTSISVSLGTDKKSINAKITSTNAGSIEYSIQGCRNIYGSNAACTKRLNSALDKFSYNEGKQDLLKFNVTGLGKCYAGAMVEGFGNIGDVAEITLDDETKFNFMILDTKNIHHKSSDNTCHQWSDDLKEHISTTIKDRNDSIARGEGSFSEACVNEFHRKVDEYLCE